jgi:putative methyltransferase (TIGR04325 family)
MSTLALKRLAKDWVPPAVHASLRRHFRHRAPWEYVGDEWPQSDRRADGWNDASVTAVLEAQWPRYLELARSAEPWAYWPWATEGRDAAAQHNLLAFAYCIARIASETQRFSVLDWGGTFGHFASIACAAAPLANITYQVKDRPPICAIGSCLNPSVGFFDTDEAAFASRYSLVLASNALQYSRDWRGTLSRLAGSATSWLLILALPTVRRSPDFVVVQRPRHVGFAEDYISWVFNRDEFLSHIHSCGFGLEREFLSIGRLDAMHAPEVAEHAGFLFRRH